MIVAEIHDMNEKLQQSAINLSELIPSSSLVRDISIIIRSTGKVDKQFQQLILKKEQVEFNQNLDILENELDEIIFILDSLEKENKERRIDLVKDFLNEGNSLIACYSRAIDFLLKRQSKKENI